MGYVMNIWEMMGWKLVGQESCAEGRGRSLFRVLCRQWPEEDTKTKLNSVALVRERTIPTELPPPVGEVSANFCG